MYKPVALCREKKNTTNNGLVIISSLVLASIMVILIFALKKITPFGGNTILVGDVKNQYLPFFQYYKTSVCDGKLTTFQPYINLGGSYFGIVSYYLMSPFNLILLLFPLNMMPEALCLIVVLKIGMCGGCFAAYLCYGPFRGNGLRYVLFSCSYALMSWNMVCYQNVIWLDGIYMLPIMALGVERLLAYKKGELFIISTSLCLLFNYYIAWFNVVFITIYFLVRVLLKDTESRKRIKFLIRFMCCGICSAGLCTFFIIPVVYSLVEGKVQNENYISLKYKTAELSSVFKMLIPQSYNGTYLESGPYIFAGSIIVILCVLYLIFANGGIKPRLIFLSIFLFYFASFTMYPLNTAWHGFTTPAMIPSRFSYTCSFLMIMYAEFGAESLEKSFVVLKFKDKYASLTKTFTVILTIYTIFELYLNGSYILGKTLEEQFFAIKDEYLRIVDTTECFMECDSFDNSYRTYDSQNFTLNDGMLNGYGMISGYSSAYSNSLSKFYNKVGMGVSRSYDCILRDVGLTPVMADILSVKNIVKCEEEWCYDFAESYGYSELYVNHDAFTPLYMVSDHLLTYELLDDQYINTYDNPFALQNSIASGLCDSSTPIFTITQFDKGIESDCETWTSSVNCGGILWMYVPFETDSLDVQYEYKAEINDGREIRINVNNMSYCICLGNYAKNEPVSIKIYNDGKLGNPVFAFLDLDKLGGFADSMSDNMATDIKCHSSGITANIKSDGNEAILFTYPYSSGLKMYVDGKEVNYSLFMDVFPMTGIGEGTHFVELKYCIPGMRIGLLISAVFAIIIVVIEFCTEFKHQNN